MLIKVISDPVHMHEIAMDCMKREQSLGLVPTMGALHDGHLQLVRKSLEDNDCTVVSIFVNPLQFNSKEDLDKYPRTFEEDLTILKEEGVDYVFSPSDEEFYKNEPIIKIDFGSLETVLEGEHRPGHFKGVGLVVSKLFNVISPNRAYFGLKDLQQYLLIKQMGKDLSFPVEVVGVDTIREKSGLAMSSRNRRLSDEGLKVASNIYRTLLTIKEDILSKENLEDSLVKGRAILERIGGIQVEYLEVVDGSTLEALVDIQGKDELAICFAGYVEGIRLIDNLYLRLN